MLPYSLPGHDISVLTKVCSLKLMISSKERTRKTSFIGKAVLSAIVFFVRVVDATVVDVHATVVDV